MPAIITPALLGKGRPHLHYQEWPLLVACPASARIHWRDELLRITPGQDDMFHVQNISTIWVPDLYIYKMKTIEMRKVCSDFSPSRPVYKSACWLVCPFG